MRKRYDFSKGVRNPYLGNSGMEFKQAAARLLLLQAIDMEGGNVGAADALIEKGFLFAKENWEKHHNRILPHKDWAALRHTATLEIARLIASGEARRNPGDYPVMSYAAAHAWEAQAAERRVSTVARSSRGFMRAYQEAGSWARLSPWWKRRRAGFIARHMAQAERGERLWEKVRGKWRPSRRALALICWAFMPPGKPAGCRP